MKKISEMIQKSEEILEEVNARSPHEVAAVAQAYAQLAMAKIMFRDKLGNRDEA